MTPIFPVTTPPTCHRCGHRSVHDIVKPENPNGNAGRPYFRCKDGCHPQTSEFVSWDDYGGIKAGNPPCWCPDRFTSRRDKTNKEPRKYFYKCPLGRCRFIAWGGEVEAHGGSGHGYGGGGGSGVPVPAWNGVYVNVEETQDDWTGAAGLSGHTTYARPAYETQMDHDSAYGSQAAGPSEPTANFGRGIETQSYHGEAVPVPSGPKTEKTRSNRIGAGAASSNGHRHAMPSQPSQSLQKQTEETRPINGVTSGAPVFTPIAGKGGDISISSMEDAYGRNFGAARRRRCCGICAVM